MTSEDIDVNEQRHNSMNLALGKPTQSFRRQSGELNSMLRRRGPFASVQGQGFYDEKRNSQSIANKDYS